MSGFDYGRAQATAARLVLKFGADAILRKKAVPLAGDDPWAPSQGAGVDTPITVVLANYNDIERAGTLIQQGDRKVIFGAGLSVIPIEGDQIVIGSRAFTIVALTTAEPGAVAIVYIAQVRL